MTRFFVIALLLLGVASLASGLGLLAFLALESARPQDAEDALLEDLNQEIGTAVEIRPNAVNPAAVTEAQAAVLIDELPAVLEELERRNVPLDNKAAIEAATRDSVEAIVEEDEGLRDATVPALEESVADNIAEQTLNLATPIADNISAELSPQDRENLTGAILEGALEGLVDEGISPTEGEESKIAEVVDQVVEAEVEEADARNKVDEEPLKSELTAAVAGLQSIVTEAVNEDIEEAATETGAVEGLDQDDLNQVTAAVADQATERLVPDLNERILEENLNPSDPSDDSEIKRLIHEEVTRALGEVLPESDPDELEELAAGLAVSTHESVTEVGPKFDAPTGLGGWGSFGSGIALLSALGFSVSLLIAMLAFVGRQFWSPRISVGGILLLRSGGTYRDERITSTKIHRQLDPPAIAFKLAYAGPAKAILERIEFKPERSFPRSLRLAVDPLTWFGRSVRPRSWVRAQDAQQLRINPDQEEPAEFKDLALPMVLNPGDQLFIRAKSPGPVDDPDCTRRDDDKKDPCDKAEMISLKLRGNFRAYSFRIAKEWEEQEFPVPTGGWRKAIFDRFRKA